MKQYLVSLAVAGWAWVCPLAQGAELATLNPVADAAMYAENGNNGNGSGQFLFIGKSGGVNARRSLVKFDIAGALPAGASIQGVTLRVTAANTQGTNNPARLYRATETWSEGTTDPSGAEGAGAAAALGDTTWTHRTFNTLTWSAPGGSFDNSTNDSVLMSGSGAYTWATSATLVSTVQGWLDTPATNSGWLVVGDETTAGSTAKQLSSRSGTAPPVLTLTYLLPSYNPVLTVNVSAPATINVAQVINYGISVSHDVVGGDGSDVSNLAVSGSLGGAAVYQSGDMNTNNLLESGETWVFASSYTVLPSDPDTLTNTVTLNFEDERAVPKTQTASVQTSVNHLQVGQVSPALVSATEGDAVTLQVAATGGYGSYLYTWTFDDGVHGPQALPTPGDTLGFANISIAQAGSYTCEVTDSVETRTSQAFVVTVAFALPVAGSVGITALTAALCAAALAGFRHKREE